MTAITIFNGVFCDARPVVEHVAEITGYRLVDDREIIADAARLSGRKRAAFSGLFDPEAGGSPLAAPERNGLVAWLRYAVARKLSGGEDLVFWGYSALLTPRNCGNILAACLVNERNDRLWTACRDGRHTEAQAVARMTADDRVRGEWVVDVTDCNDPWSETLYDVVVPVGALGVRQSACLIVEQLANGVVRDSEATRACAEDFRLAARVRAELARAGHDVAVVARDGSLTLSLEDHDATLASGARDLFEEIAAMAGVRGVEIGAGRRYNPNDVFQRAACARPCPDAAAREDAACTSARAEDVALAEAVRSRIPFDAWGVSVFVKDGFVSLTINDHARLVERMARRVCDLAARVEGVADVTFGIGREYHLGAACKRVRRELCRTLLADERRKFLPTLSARLQRDGGVGAFALYDGKSVFYTMEEPEVVLLDMPDSGGPDVLRRFKRDHPATEVLVLSDRKAEQERETCMNLGAFACLHKPVNSVALSETIRAACEKSRACACS
ncbi:response regulator receiver [Pseudodesulfovibrio mercurii]|uniref:Response regulator receiver n=1 Tax=Pseudodesulfovibrio mercurii TaxID=641491 RepID=F0JFB4_9BACT|nr:response regulator [Pseudodesulfovibrio mercurii]EGB13670.1 response regulator receiver [Pseudodesulfovibrio mercurii]